MKNPGVNTEPLNTELLNIVADENIPGLETWFGDLGTITRVAGRTLQPSDLLNADVLLVRSVTQVSGALLQGTPVRFVGSCTIGTDHLDTQWLEEQGIAWSAAPGCNANSVVEYVFCVLAALNMDWRGRSFGIVGCGNVGGALQQRLQALGNSCKVYDPWLQDNPNSASLESVLQQDVICLHAPLVKDGLHPSYHRIDEQALASIKAGAVLISAGRGAVIDNRALLKLLEQQKKFTAALDVWENEPDINLDLLAQVNLGSPHIAGYSLDGKLAGTRMIRLALDGKLSRPECDGEESPEESRPLKPLTTDKFGFDALQDLLLKVYDPREDDRRLREAAEQAAGGQQPMATAFDLLRKHYPQRLEFSHYKVEAPQLDETGLRQLKILGFN